MSVAPEWVQTWVTASDGVQLAVYTAGPPGAPVVLCVHGYPDDHRVWDSVVADLARDLRVVAYDVRGAGASDVPPERNAYRADQLADDVARVASTTGDAPVHLLAHDWGSVQAWRAATADGAGAEFRVADVDVRSGSGLRRSVVGPYLAHRQTGRATSGRVVLVRRNVPAARRRRPAVAQRTRATPTAEVRAGPLDPGRGTRPGALPRQLRVPFGPASAAVRDPGAGVVVARRDQYLTAPLVTEAPAPYVGDLRVAEVDGGHWTFVAHPERLTGPVRALLAELGST